VLRSPPDRPAKVEYHDVTGGGSSNQFGKINCWARLDDGDHAWRLVRKQLEVVDSTQTNYSRAAAPI
jgi:hypothetical protein